jgi:hypothetical protein
MDLPPPARRQLGTLGDPADLTAVNTMIQGAAVSSAAPLFLVTSSSIHFAVAAME